MIFVYLLLTILLIMLFIIGFIFIKNIYRFIDKTVIEENFENIKTKAELVEDIEKFEKENSDKLEKSKSEKLKEYIK